MGPGSLYGLPKPRDPSACAEFDMGAALAATDGSGVELGDSSVVSTSISKQTVDDHHKSRFVSRLARVVRATTHLRSLLAGLFEYLLAAVRLRAAHAVDARASSRRQRAPRGRRLVPFVTAPGCA